MAQTAFPFVDPYRGKGSAVVEPARDAVVLAVSLAGKDGVEIRLSQQAAVEFAQAILAAAGEKFQRQLPQSRQIGGIIGPY